MPSIHLLHLLLLPFLLPVLPSPVQSYLYTLPFLISPSFLFIVVLPASITLSSHISSPLAL
jgi:hypothetical protein